MSCASKSAIEGTAGASTESIFTGRGGVHRDSQFSESLPRVARGVEDTEASAVLSREGERLKTLAEGAKAPFQDSTASRAGPDGSSSARAGVRDWEAG